MLFSIFEAFHIQWRGSVKPGCVPKIEYECEDYADKEFQKHQKRIDTPNKGDGLKNATRLLNQQGTHNG